MDGIKNIVIGTFFGVLYAYLSVHIIGIGAAIAIPRDVLDALFKIGPTTAFGLIDLVVIGLPLIIVYYLFALMVSHFNANKSYFPYLALFVPFFIQEIYFISALKDNLDVTYLLITVIPRYLAIGLCVRHFVNQAISQTVH